MQKIIFTSLLACSICLTSCNKYPGYKKISGGVFFKLLQIGESTVRPKIGDFVTVDIEYRTLKDSLFFKGIRKLQIHPPAYKGSIEQCLVMLATEEKARFILPAGNFYRFTLNKDLPPFINEKDDMIVVIHMLQIQAERDYLNEKAAFYKWIQDFGEYERIILKQYIDENKIDIQPTANGLYYLSLRKGNEKKVEKGKKVTIHYEGRFLNGKFFDSTKMRKEPFSFVYGEQLQVIKGLEEGIALMSEGEKALFIVPSDLAFGVSGSSTGIIPPYTSLIFEVELLQVE